jgi:transposase
LAFSSAGSFPSRHHPIYLSIPLTLKADGVPLDDQPHRLWPWRDLPERFGFWNCVYVRYHRAGAKAESGSGLFEAVLDEPDFEYVMIDSAIVRAHQHTAGEKGWLRIKPFGALEADIPPKSMLL